MNEQEFFDLAVKVVNRRSSDAERTELEALIGSQPELKAEFERIQADARLAREVLPLLAAVESSSGEFPAYARERLQTKVQQTLGRPQKSPQPAGERELKIMWRWRWVLGLAAATAVAALVLVPVLSRPSAPVIEVAMLDAAGPTRGSDRNEAELVRQTWQGATVISISDVEVFRSWATNWPAQGKRPVVKVFFDRATGELHVGGRWKGRNFERSFSVDQDLATTLKQADAFIKEQLAR
jgi:hypothetical protein